MDALEEVMAVEKILDLMKPLSKYAQGAVILRLLKDRTIDYTTLSEQYVNYLQHQEKDKQALLTECETIIAEDLIDRKPKKQKPMSEWLHNHIHRALYFLNQRMAFQMSDLNEHFGYDEEKDKELSWYYRSKGGNVIC